MMRILIIAADPLVRSALGGLVEQGEELTVVGQAAPEEESVELFNVYRPDVVLVDAGWSTSADELLPLLDEWELPIILLLPEDAQDVGQLISAGFGGLLLRTLDGDQLEAAVRAVAQRLIVVDPAFSESVTVGATPSTQFEPLDFETLNLEPLTPREFDVLEHLAEGLTNREIAAKLGISHHTVKFHLTSLMDKLDVHSRTEAVTTASRLGILEI